MAESSRCHIRILDGGDAEWQGRISALLYGHTWLQDFASYYLDTELVETEKQIHVTNI
jgi:hypothetical protein